MKERIVGTNELIDTFVEKYGYDKRFAEAFFSFMVKRIRQGLEGKEPVFSLGTFGAMVSTKEATRKLLQQLKRDAIKLDTLGDERWDKDVLKKINNLEHRLVKIDKNIETTKRRKTKPFSKHERKVITTIVKNA